LAPGQQAEPFVDTEEPTRLPATAVGKDRVAFIVGTGSDEKIAIATIGDGRIQRRLATVTGGDIRALAGSADGKMLFYAEAGAIWAIPTDDGAPRRIHEGDSVAPSPTGDYLLVKIQTKDAVRLVRISSSDSSEQPIPVRGDLQLSFDPLSPNAVGTDGRIAVRTESKDSWYWPAGILDPRTGIITRIPLSTGMDMMSPGWTSDGRLITLGHPTRSTLWRFQQRTP
jgi:hypothetical protein